MDKIYNDVIRYMRITVDNLARRVPEPQRIQTGGQRMYRHVERTAQQAIVQKLARLVSTLSATHLLLDHGFVQEVGALKRILDEILEDVLFLLSGLDAPSAKHKEFLEYFFAEEFDAHTAFESTQKRGMIPRKKIRAHNARLVSELPGSPLDPSRTTENFRTINKAYSGYVHAASPQIMEMYGGDPPRFHMVGMLGTPLVQEHRTDFRNYVYRAICALSLATRALGDDAGSDKIRNYARWYDKEFLGNG